MKIVKLHITNFLKLRDVEMNPSKTNVIVGKNKQGKTSIVKAIEAAFDGKLDPSAIRIGEDKAEITVELDEMTIRRTLTEKGAYLDISNKEGMKMPSPQKYLDGILGTFSFNPVEFFELKPAEQKTYLLNAIKMTLTPEELAPYLVEGEIAPTLDYTKHALEVVSDARKVFYDRRTVANSEVTKKRKSIDEMAAKIPQGFDPSKVDEKHIAELRAAIEKDKIEREKEKANVQAIERLMKDEVGTLEEIDRLNKKLEGIRSELEEKRALTFDTSDDMTISAAEESLAKLEGQREIVFTYKRVQELQVELGNAVGEQEKLENVVKRLTKDVPAMLIAKAALPVEGLAVTEEGITLNGVSIENLSSSEQLRFALTVVRALNATFKVICIDGVELLDTENFEVFLKEIESDDYQYFITRVDGNVKDGIVIEDGAIKVPTSSQ